VPRPRFDSLRVAIAAAKLVLLDTLAPSSPVAPCENASSRDIAAARAPHGAVTVLGYRGKSDAFWAAMTNPRGCRARGRRR